MINQNKGKLYTSYFASGKSEGLKIAIVRYKPKWLDFDKERIVHMQGLSPSNGILKVYKGMNIEVNDGMLGDWLSFSQMFRFELNNLDEKRSAIAKVKNVLDEGNNVTLLCYEKDDSRCHRGLIEEYFSKLGYKVKEL